MRWFGREPAQWLQLASGVLILFSPVFALGIEAQGALNGFLTALFGFLTMVFVAREKAAPLVAGLIKASIAVALAFRLNLDPETQVALMVGVEAIVAFWLRTQVVAPIPADPNAPPVPQRAREQQEQRPDKVELFLHRQ